jgi:cytidylate kinase
MKIVIIRGKSGAGKTTISYELAKVLPKYAFIDIWKIKEMFEPLRLENRDPQNKVSKDTVYYIIKSALKNKVIKNFIIQESTAEKVKINLKDFISKKDKIYSFYLDVELKEALKRNKTRKKITMDKKHFINQSTKNLPKIEKEDFVINTSKNSIKEVIDIILREIKEKRGKKCLTIRKCV